MQVNNLNDKQIQFLKELAGGVPNGEFLIMESDGFEWVRVHKNSTSKDYWNPDNSDEENSEKERLDYLKMVDDLSKGGYIRLESVDKSSKTYKITLKGKQAI